MLYKLLKRGLNCIKSCMTSVIYYYKLILLHSVLYSLRKCVLFYDYLTRKEDSIKPKGVVEVDEKYVIHEYDIIHNNKLHEVCFISEKYNIDKVNKKLVLLSENKEDVLSERYKFVHCSIINRDGECVLDITNDMRAFMFYFSDKRYICDINYVIKYLVSKNEKLSELDMKDYKILFYMNDDEFTQRIIELNNGDLFLHNIIEM